MSPNGNVSRIHRAPQIAFRTVLLFFLHGALFCSAEEIRLQLKWYHQFQFAGYYAAEARGFYAHEGLKVTIIEGNTGRPPIREVLARRADLPGLEDIGHMNPGRWQAIARTYANIGLIDRAPSEQQLSAFIYHPDAGRFDRWAKSLVMAAGALTLAAIWILLWNLQLRRAVARRTAALKLTEQQLRYHVENSPLAVIEWDNQLRVLRWTGQAEQVFGWTAAEVLGRHPRDWGFVYEEDAAAVEAVLQRLIRRDEKRNFSANRNYRKDGSIVHCEWYNSGSEQENLKTVLSFALDVTERKRPRRS